MKAAFAGGSLSFKGDKKKKAKKKKSTTKHEVQHKKIGEETASCGAATAAAAVDPTDDMTDAERKAFKRKQERELKDLEKQASKSHRERVEEFNEKLASLTELNDIPRVRRNSVPLTSCVVHIVYAYTSTRSVSDAKFSTLFFFAINSDRLVQLAMARDVSCRRISIFMDNLFVEVS
jgi:protein FAM32A